MRITPDTPAVAREPIYSVTLSDLRKEGACYDGYNKVVRMLRGETFSDEDVYRESYIKSSRDEPIPLVDIAKNNGIDDALWALRCVPGCERDARLFAVWAARRVEHLMTDERSREALNVAERFANGAATAEALDAAREAACAVATDAATDAARAVATDAARDAAWAVATDAARDAAWDAAWAAAWAAARDAARDAARAAARAAARDAAWDAAKVAAWVAAWVAAKDVARDVARDAAWAAARDAAKAAARGDQLSMFIAMCEGRAPWHGSGEVKS